MGGKVKEEKKEKKDKEKDEKKKDKKEKKDDKKEKKEKDDKKDDKKPSVSQTLVSSELDHRKLFKEGQKSLTPPVADATRAFYESLLEENPDSKIAIKFCVEYGVLPLEGHKKLLKKYNNLKDSGAFNQTTAIKKMLDKK